CSAKCTGCAACVVACPLNCLRYEIENPVLSGKCSNCEICSHVCTRYSSAQGLEKTFFGRERRPDEKFGVYQKTLVAKSTDKHILKVCQDGGVATTLLTFALKNNIIEGAAVSGINKKKPLQPLPVFATTTKQLLESAGTRYCYSPNLLALKEGIKQGKKAMAFVGTPCQIEALRRMQMIPLKNYAERLKLTIGLMCSECYSYEGLVEDYIGRKLQINPADVDKIQIKAKLILTMKSGNVKEYLLRDLHQYARNACKECADFSAELADISLGGLGLIGWSLVVVRTETGKEFLEKALAAGLLETKPIEEAKHSLELLIKLSTHKQSRMS
ncbi:MAG TPA: Coenzyme F420 hydrogenase/dehydrogenase, beta subunit C-terminal domain, partial [Candidatus Bathyarchaeia archaeon]|nr:Coenzyme F420 hydrogenase/dehydrogenase, beta subunit C-terminal domain [Candidatus Bathyarchaeia archaeon]